MVEKILEGHNGTLIAYGETGSGKTFSFSGARDNSDFEQRGISPRALGTIFSKINSASYSKGTNFNVSISYLEIQGTLLIDLLQNTGKNRLTKSKSLEIYEDPQNPGTTKVKNLNKIKVNNESEAFNLFLLGDSRRSHKTSHSIFTVYVESDSLLISGGAHKRAELKIVDLCSWGSSKDKKIVASKQPSSLF